MVSTRMDPAERPVGVVGRAIRSGLMRLKSVRRMPGAVSLAVSLSLHATLIVLGFFVVWSAAPASPEDRGPIVVTFENPSPPPLRDAPEPPDRSESLSASAAASTRTWPGASTDSVLPRSESALPAATTAARPTNESIADAIHERRVPEVRFAGLGVSNARIIVYVVDASGSMVGSLPAVLNYLERSVSRLSRTQRFQVIFYGRSPHQAAPHPGDADDGTHWRLIRATPDHIRQVLAWCRRIVPGGRSNPVPALRLVFALPEPERPDAVFLLSNVVTGAGEWETDKGSLLAEIDALNPVRPETGRRRTVIKTLQFLEDDPEGILRAIGEAHGGADGYKFIPGLEQREP